MAIPIEKYAEKKAKGIARVVAVAADPKLAKAEAARWADDLDDQRTWFDEGFTSKRNINDLITQAQADKQRIQGENDQRIAAAQQRIDDLQAMKPDVLAIVDPTDLEAAKAAPEKKERKKKKDGKQQKKASSPKRQRSK